MPKHYIRLLTDVELNDRQQHIWYTAVDKFTAGAQSLERTLQVQSMHADELQGNEDFPYVYVVYLPGNLDIQAAERIVVAWDNIYPRDFEIETSADYDSACDDSEIDLEIREEVQKFTNKYLHNRWVDDMVLQGWRYGARKNTKERTDPRIQNWDSLNESLRERITLTDAQIMKMIKDHPQIF